MTAGFIADNWSSARAHLERGLALYDPAQQRSLTVLFAENARVSMLSFLSLDARTSWLRRAGPIAEQGSLAEARELSHPISLAFALSVACRLHFVLAEPHRSFDGQKS